MASLLDISRATLYRRLQEAGISADDQTPIQEQQLDDIIRSIKKDHSNDGELLMQGHLVRQGIKVPRQSFKMNFIVSTIPMLLLVVILSSIVVFTICTPSKLQQSS